METLSEELIRIRKEYQTNYYNLLAEKKRNALLVATLKETVNVFKPHLKKMNIRKNFSELNIMANAEKVLQREEMSN